MIIKTERKDRWQVQEDELLADLTIRYIAEGKSQQDAFEEVGRRLGRTAAACGFRFNGCLRQQFEDRIKEAKRKRIDNQAAKRKAVSRTKRRAIELLSWDDVFHSLSRVEEREKELVSRAAALEAELNTAKEENAKLTQQLAELKELGGSQAGGDDYAALVKILQRARSLGFLDQDMMEKQRFHMDANGNLERIG